MPRKSSKFIAKKGNDTEIEDFLPHLVTIDTISKKMEKLCELSVLNEYDLAERTMIYNYIHRLFTRHFPGCELITFGSSVNGFGTKGCDMDLMFSLSHVSEQLVRRNLGPQLMNTDKDEQLRRLLKVLRRECNSLIESVYIPAKCPIVRFRIVHGNYDLWCDLSCQHGLALANSKLLFILSALDYRVKPLMITLRFWGKHFKVINTSAFSSYAFSLLVIFFLQNIEEPILPSLNMLMINAESCIIEDWAAGFLPDVPKDFKSRNTLSEEELLKKFFLFYWDFEFTKNVVCVRTGKVMPITDIRKDTDERMKNFMISDVCVQDPFNLSHNVAASLRINKLHLLKPYFFVANLILSKQLVSLEPENVFQDLFEKEFFKTEIKEHFFVLSVNAISSFYVYPNFQVMATIGDNLKIWLMKACDAIRDILEYIFLFGCEVIDKNVSLTNDDDVWNRNHDTLLLSIECAVDNDVYKHFNDRQDKPVDSYKQNFDNEVLNKGNALSLYLLASEYAIRKNDDVAWFLCNLYRSKYAQIPYIWIELIPLKKREEIKSVGKVLREYLPAIVQEMLIE